MTLPTNHDLHPLPKRFRLPLPRGVDLNTQIERETRRELAKLTATYYNGLAVAMFAVGGLAPLVSLFAESEKNQGWSLAAFSLIFIGSSLIAHVGARYSLRKEYEK